MPNTRYIPRRFASRYISTTIRLPFGGQLLISIYKFSDLGDIRILNGSLSRANVMTGVNLRFATISDAEILEIQDNAKPKRRLSLDSKFSDVKQ